MSAGSKSRLAKAAGAEVAAQSRQEKLHAAVARSTFQVKMCTTPQLRSTVQDDETLEKIIFVIGPLTKNDNLPISNWAVDSCNIFFDSAS